MRTWTVFPLLGILLAGCLSGTAPDDAKEDPFLAIVQDHDHNDLSFHTAHAGMSWEAWSTLGQTLGEQGFANFVFWTPQDEPERLLAFVAVDGDTQGGFVIADLSDPLQVTVVGSYIVDGNSFQEVRVSPDGRWAVLNVQTTPDRADLLDGDGASDCTVCLHVVDVADMTSPRLSSVLPVELLGSHNMHFEPYADGTYLFFVNQPLYLPYPDPGNRITVARLVEVGTEALLAPVATFDHNDPMREGRSFPHDVLVQEHPDGRKIAYVSHWDGGHVLFDVTDPTRPQKLAVLDDATPSDALAVHWIMQEHEARADGRTIAWSAPEIGDLATGTGVIRALDISDPTAPTQLSTWTLPGDLRIEGQYRLSPHTTVPHPDRPLLAVTHYHAGVWVLDTTDPADPQHVAFYQPHGDPTAPYDGPLWWKKPNFDPEGYGPNVYQARWDPRDPDRVWVTDRGTGLYALRLDR